MNKDTPRRSPHPLLPPSSFFSLIYHSCLFLHSNVSLAKCCFTVIGPPRSPFFIATQIRPSSLHFGSTEVAKNVTFPVLFFPFVFWCGTNACYRTLLRNVATSRIVFLLLNPVSIVRKQTHWATYAQFPHSLCTFSKHCQYPFRRLPNELTNYQTPLPPLPPSPFPYTLYAHLYGRCM